MVTGTSTVEKTDGSVCPLLFRCHGFNSERSIKQSLRTLFNCAHIAIDTVSDCLDQLDVVINAVCDLQISCHHHLHLFLSECI